ncbi:MAG TPA: hypothetical protein VGE16_17050 [Albitalea sp.]
MTPSTCHRAANVVIPTTCHGSANVVVPATCHGAANVVIPTNAGIHRAGETRLDPGVRRGDGAWKRSVLRAQRSVRREIARGAVGALK